MVGRQVRDEDTETRGVGRVWREDKGREGVF